MAKAEVRFHPEALAELKAAFDWYHERNPIVAMAFQKEAERAVSLVAKDPHLWPTISPSVRRYVFPKFPFSLVYRMAGQTVEVLAVVHQKRKPGYWKAR